MNLNKIAQKRLVCRQKVTFWYSVLLLTVFLFYFDARGYQGISQAKFQIFLGLSMLYFAAMALLAMDQLLSGQFTVCSPSALWRQMGWPQRLVVIYLGVTWLSALSSPWWPATIIGASRFEGALSITFYCLSFLLISAYGRPDRRLLAVLGGSVTLFCLLCLVQMAGYNPFGLYPSGYGYADAGTAYAGAYLGTIGNVDLVAAFLSLVLPLLLYAVIHLSGWLRYALLIPLILAAAVLARMSVMAGLVGAGAGCLLALPVAGTRSAKARWKLALLVCGVILSSLAAVFLVDFNRGLPHELYMLLHGQAFPSFGSGRLYIWSQVLERIPEHPLLGAGPDTMLFARLTPFIRYDPQLDYTITAQIDSAHCEYLNILYHQGIIALATYSGLLGMLAAGWAFTALKDSSVAILGAGTLGYCIQAFFGISCPLSAPFFWLALGLLAGQVRRNTTRIFET